MALAVNVNKISRRNIRRTVHESVLFDCVFVREKMTNTVPFDEENSNVKKDGFICGVIEGFYGRPWTTEQRKDLFRK